MSLIAVVAPIVGTGGLVALVSVCLRHGSDAVLKLGVVFHRDQKHREDCIKALRALADNEDADPPDG